MTRAAFWRGKRILLTGHTGFKGSWLSLWLHRLGAEVHGYALEPATSPSLYDEARVGALLDSTIADITDLAALRRCIGRVRPEIVIHMAAQPLVRRSYREPVLTYATNVMGTVHVLEALREVGSARVIVNVTSDKCYANREVDWAYREDEPMGGHDPYSSSKGCAELVTAAYRSSYFASGPTALASARAGNVIGGGDWAEDRLVPDLLRAFAAGESVAIRHPQATRPWQHVLEPLSGYLTLAERLWEDGPAHARGWNFGPALDDARPVAWIAERLAAAWGPDARWHHEAGDHPHEAARLHLDIQQAAALGWAPRWSLDTALQTVVDWHRRWLAGGDVRAACLEQIDAYLHAARTTP